LRNINFFARLLVIKWAGADFCVSSRK